MTAPRFPDEPIHQVEWRLAADLRANAWNPNRVHRQELRLLEANLLAEGWLQPLLVNATGLIIDGFHRWRLSQDSKPVLERWSGYVPVVVKDIGDDEAMALTVRMNRAKGTHGAVAMHELVVSLIAEHGWTAKRVAASIGASMAEVELLCREGVFAAKGTATHAYSPAWYPAEGRTEELVTQHSREAMAAVLAEQEAEAS